MSNGDNEENLNDLYSSNKQGSGSGQNPITKAKDTVKGAQDATKMASKVTNKAASKFQGKKAGQILSKMSKGFGKANAQLTKVSKVALKLSKYLATIGWIILIVICIIGLLVFILTGIGLLVSAVQDLFDGFLKAWDEAENGTEDVVSEADINNLANKLNEMGYDLFGYGFIPESTNHLFHDDGGKLAMTIGDGSLANPNDSEKALDTRYEGYKYLRTYIVSDNYVYCIKNSNKNLKEATSSISNFFSGLFIDKSNWGTGLLSVSFDTGTFGERKNEESGIEWLAKWTPATFIWSRIVDEVESIWYPDVTDIVSISDEGPSIKTGKYDNTSLQYKLDGWAGRYGMPLEFLLATHVATMAPDLSLKMVTSFDTDVEILLHKVTGSDLQSGVKIGEDVIDDKSISKYDSDDYYTILQETSINSLKTAEEAGEGNEDFVCTHPPVWSKIGNHDSGLINGALGIYDYDINDAALADENDFVAGVKTVKSAIGSLVGSEDGYTENSYSGAVKTIFFDTVFSDIDTILSENSETCSVTEEAKNNLKNDIYKYYTNDNFYGEGTYDPSKSKKFHLDETFSNFIRI